MKNLRKQGGLLEVSAEERTTRILEQKQPYVSITLKKQSRGYAWDIHVVAEDEHEALSKVDALNAGLQGKYGNSRKPTWTNILAKKSNVEEDVLP
jgi:hypothetical protein